MDPFELQRFRDAQAPVYERALSELRAGRKRTHWMWFVFPQLRGLGQSPLAQRFGIASLDEARAYLADPLLGARLIECTETVLQRGDVSLAVLFGSPDDVKFHSSMTLFALAASRAEHPFQRALDRDFAGRADERTLAMIGA